MNGPTPSSNGHGTIRFAEFATIREALDNAAQGETGLNFYSARGELLESVTYRQLRAQAVSLARRLLRTGLSKGERLAILAETNADFVRLFCACQYAGIVPVPLPLPATFGGRKSYVAQIRRQIETSGAVGAASPLDFHGLMTEAARDLPMRLVGTFEQITDAPDGGVVLPAVGPDDLCYVQFSSGSTRFPLGVAVTQRALMTNAAAISRWGLQVRPGDRCVSWLPFYHDMGLVGFLLTPIAAQLSVDYLATRDFARRPLLWLSLLSRNGGTISYSPSFGYDLCTRRGVPVARENLDLSRWRVAGIGGDMIRPQVLDGFAAAFRDSGFRRDAFLASYGLAEATLAVSFAPLYRGIKIDRVDANRLQRDRAAVPVIADRERTIGRARDLVLCGRPLPGVAVEIRDDSSAPLSDRLVGRIFVRGQSVMAGYLNEPAETGRTLSRDGWLDTGDLGYWLDGAIVIVGRHKDLIIVNGRNIAPQDLEWAAEQVPGVRPGDVAAFSIDDGDTGERVVLVVECRFHESAARKALSKAIVGAVQSAAAVECDVLLVPPRSLPYTSSGKLSRSQARRKFLLGEYAPSDAAVRSKIEPAAAAHTR